MDAPKYRILIAERNPHVRGFLGRELARSNLLVSGARNSDEVFSALDSASPPHLIVLAVDTPNTGDMGLLERITELYPHVPVVLHSYHDEPIESGVAELAAEIVVKNGNPERLTHTVLNLLRAIQRYGKPATDGE